MSPGGRGEEDALVLPRMYVYTTTAYRLSDRSCRINVLPPGRGWVSLGVCVRVCGYTADGMWLKGLSGKCSVKYTVLLLLPLGQPFVIVPGSGEL